MQELLRQNMKAKFNFPPANIGKTITYGYKKIHL